MSSATSSQEMGVSGDVTATMVAKTRRAYSSGARLARSMRRRKASSFLYWVVMGGADEPMGCAVTRNCPEGGLVKAS